MKLNWKWGWNGDICAIFGEAMILWQTKKEAEKKAKFIITACKHHNKLLSSLKEMVNNARRDHDTRLAVQKAMAVIAEIESFNPAESKTTRDKGDGSK